MCGGVLVLIGPSGSGKTTLQTALAETFPDHIERAISYTTRPARPNEVNGVDYHFVTDEAFDALVAVGAFLEHTRYGANRYGSTKGQLRRIVDAGKVCVQVVERQGCDAYREVADALNVHAVFVSAPRDALRERIGADRPDAAKRMADVDAMEQYSRDHDLPTIWNVDRDAAVRSIRSFFTSWFGAS